MENIVIALIAFAGTLLTVGVGYLQWKRQQTFTQSQKFQGGRGKAYEELWRILEKTHLELRGGQIGDPEFEKSLKSVNTYILKNSLYVDRVDAQMANDYLESVFELSREIGKSKDKRLKKAWNITSPLPSDTLAEYEYLKTIWEKVDSIYDKMLARFRQIIKDIT